MVSGCHLQGGGSIYCHSNHLTTEEGDIELSINIGDVSFIYGINFDPYITHKLMFNPGHNMKERSYITHKHVHAQNKVST